MRKAIQAVTLMLGLGVVLAIAASPTAAAPPPASYGQPTLSIDSACNFTSTVTWSHTKVDSVQFTVHVVGSLSSNQMTSTLKGRMAMGTLAGGAAAAHTFDITADFFLNGALVSEQTSSPVDAACGFSL
jgi:hypothetical protein